MEHETLSREQVAKRLFEAAKIGGYKIGGDSFLIAIQTADTHLIVYDTGHGFRFNHSGTNSPEHLTLEEFEQHCENLKNQDK